MLDILIKKVLCDTKPVQGGAGGIPEEVTHRFPSPPQTQEVDSNAHLRVEQVMGNKNEAKPPMTGVNQSLLTLSLPENLVLHPPETGNCG